MTHNHAKPNYEHKKKTTITRNKNHFIKTKNVHVMPGTKIWIDLFSTIVPKLEKIHSSTTSWVTFLQESGVVFL